jgi:hypothetical protein
MHGPRRGEADQETLDLRFHPRQRMVPSTQCYICVCNTAEYAGIVQEEGNVRLLYPIHRCNTNSLFALRPPDNDRYVYPCLSDLLLTHHLLEAMFNMRPIIPRQVVIFLRSILFLMLRLKT